MTRTAPARSSAKRPRPVFAARPLDPESRIGPSAAQKIADLAARLDGGLPTMFEFAQDQAAVQTYEATGITFKPKFLEFLNEVERRRKATRGSEQGRVPTTMLRLLLGTRVPDILRVETNLWKLTRARLPLLISSASPQEAGRAARQALATWVNHITDLEDDTRHRLLDWVREGPFDFAHITFDPKRPGEVVSHRDLADLAAQALDGVELFPGRGPMRRVVSRDTSTNSAELMTDPFVAGSKAGALPTSYVVKFRTKTVAGQRMPRLVMELSRRQWTDNANTYHGKVTLYAMPARTGQQPNPGVITLQIDWKQHLNGIPGLDYVGLRQRYTTLPEHPLEERRVAPALLIHAECQVLAVARQGRGVKGGATGALDVDRFLAFGIAAAELDPYGLRPMTGLTRIEGLGAKQAQTPVEDFQALFAEPQPTQKQIDAGTAAKYVADKLKAARDWANVERRRMQQHYVQPYRLLLLHAAGHDASAVRAAEILVKALGEDVVITRQAMPEQTYGSVSSLPGPGDRPAERAARRLERWTSFLRELQGPFDGVMLIVPRGEGDDVNDPVNKRASKVAILKNLKVHAQYLRPIQEDKDDKDFIRRTIRAFQDLVWESLGILVPVNDDSGELSAGTPAMRGRILALTVATVNSRRGQGNEPTTVPMGLRVDLDSQQTEANLLLPSGATGWVSLREATFQLQGSTSKLNPRERGDRQKVQTFFNALLDEADTGKSDGLAEIVFIDGDTVSAFWPGLYDKYIEFDDLRFEPRESPSRLQKSWPNLTLLRLRTLDPFAKVLRQGEQEVEVAGVRFPTPRWTESETYLIGEAEGLENPVGATFLSIGATNLQPTRGMSGSLKTIKIGRGDTRRELAPHTDGYATPEALEVAVISAGGLSLRGIVDITSKLRRRYAHYDGWTKFPAPLFFGHLIKDYIPDYSSDDDEEVLDLGSD
ncbi:RNaseH domain-containing protein [Deinococcus sp. MIMF12]|uniref:RNaseH domain-containing protein n=1 Tax=Deinococcus rhizophilus TaxID=3049544 RepID=A0ABT7JL01_9DEIO|nr:RNaseH domain-containing protein [Deinococcus rhizophilus]MDL2344633.1 RNaseH domain-containing protein [Deinococcus rhizophilus]